MLDDAANQVCPHADWKGVPFFGSAVSLSEFHPEELSISSAYYRGPVEERLLPTIVLLGIAIVLLLIFLFWRILRFCCRCFCGCCCVRHAQDPERVLKGRGMTVLKMVVVLLCLAAISCCIYGMARIEPTLVASGNNVINSMLDYGNSVFSEVYGVLGDVGSVQALLGQVQTILNVDINPTNISADLACIAPFATSLSPAVALSLLQALQADVVSVDAAIPALSTNYSTLTGTEGPQYVSNAAPVTAAPAFISGYTTQTNSFITAISNLPGSYPGGTGSQTNALGAALSALGLPLSASQHPTILGIEAGLTAIFGSAPADVATFSDISSAVAAMTAASANISAAVPAVAAQLDGAYTNYTAVRPCMVDLNARIQSINDTVVVLPANISGPALELQAAMVDLDLFLLNDTSPVPALASQLTALSASVSLTPFSSSTLTALSTVQSQLSSITDPSAAGGPVPYLQSLDQATQNANSDMNACSSAYTSFAAGPSSATYNAMLSACDAASTSMTPVQAVLSASGAGGGASLTSGAANAAAVSAALGALPANTAVQALLTAAQSSISALPSVGAYIAALGPASAAYAALSPGMFSSLQDEVGDFASGIQSAISSANATVGSEVGNFTGSVNQIHNDTIDRATAYQAQYEPYVYHYDRIRQAVEYVWFLLAIVACLGLIFAALTNCQWAAGFFTLLLALLCVLFGIVAVILYTLASVGNDACTNAEGYMLEQLPAWVQDPASLNASTLAIDYYLFDEGSVPELALELFGFNISGVFAVINATRDQAVQQVLGAYTLQSALQAVVTDIYAIADSVTGRIVAAEGLASYASIHPLYLQAKAFVCCNGVNMLGDLWVASFATDLIALVLLPCMLAFLGKLDALPPRACCGCAMRSARELRDADDEAASPPRKSGPSSAAPPPFQTQHGAPYEASVAPSGRSINIMVHLDANGAPVQAAPPPPQHSFSVAPGGSGEVLRQGSGEPPRGGGHSNPVYSGATARQTLPASPSAPPYSPRYARMSEHPGNHYYQ